MEKKIVNEKLNFAGISGIIVIVSTLLLGRQTLLATILRLIFLTVFLWGFKIIGEKNTKCPIKIFCNSFYRSEYISLYTFSVFISLLFLNLIIYCFIWSNKYIFWVRTITIGKNYKKDCQSYRNIKNNSLYPNGLICVFVFLSICVF